MCKNFFVKPMEDHVGSYSRCTAGPPREAGRLDDTIDCTCMAIFCFNQYFPVIQKCVDI